MTHQQVGDEILHLSPPRLLILSRGGASALEFLNVEVDGRHRTPQIYPPLGQHGGLHGLLGREEGEDAAAEVVRQGAQPVAAADRAAFSSAGPLGGGCGHRGFLFLIYISAA